MLVFGLNRIRVLLGCSLLILKMSAQIDSILLNRKLLKSEVPRAYTNRNQGYLGIDSISTKNVGDKKSFAHDHKLPDTTALNLDSKSNSNFNDSTALPSRAKLPGKKIVKSSVSHGSISFGYDYGFLPYTVGLSSPSSVFKSEGRLETNILNIPIDITYFYSNQKNLIGLTNYLRISYNAERYKENLNNKLNNEISANKQKLTGLNIKKQQTLQKMAFADYLSTTNPDQWPLPGPLEKPEIEPDTILENLGTLDVDTVSFTKGVNSSLGVVDKYSKLDSLKQRADLHKQKKDSVAREYDTYNNSYSLLNDSIKRVEKRIAELESLLTQKPAYRAKSPHLTKIQNFLSGVKKLDVGLCYPGYSSFLVNNIPVRGINFEYEKNHRFFGFTYGTTVSTLLNNNRTLEGVFQNVRNSYNYFDANNLSSGRKILSMKFGFGEKEGDHFYAGFLVGKGGTDYMISEPDAKNFSLVESNLVLEADVRKSISKKTTLEIILGKSSLQQDNVDIVTIQTAAREVFSNFRSYAALVKLKTTITPTKSGLTLSMRWVDPFFSSYGVGFMRSDNLRYEIKLDQPLTKSLRYTGTFRREEDNLLKLLNYENTFLSVSNSFSYKVRRNLVLRLGYTPLIRKLKSSSYQITDRNSIITGIVTFTPKSRNVNKQFNFLYNNYQVSTDTALINFQNFAYYHQFTFKKGLKTGLNVSWFRNDIKDSTGNNTYLLVLDMGYQFRNTSEISIAGKFAYRLNSRVYPGFIIKSTARLCKILFWENQVEKFIVGDLFNGYDLENLQGFPYCVTTKLILNF